MHKIYDYRSWSHEQSDNIFRLFEKYCSVMILNKRLEVKERFEDSEKFEVEEFRYGSRSAYVIWRQ